MYGEQERSPVYGASEDHSKPRRTSRTGGKKKKNSDEQDILNQLDNLDHSKLVKKGKTKVSDNLAQLMEDETDRSVSAKEVKLNLKTTPRVKPVADEPNSIAEKIRQRSKYKSYTDEMLHYLLDPSKN